MVDSKAYAAKLESIKKLPRQHRSGARLLLIDELEANNG
jgi:hypothetical protein